MAVTQVPALIGPGPCTSAFTVTPSDGTVFSPPTRYLWIGGAGDVAVLMNGAAAPVTFFNVPAGTMLPLSVSKVMLTGTSASNIVGCA